MFLELVPKSRNLVETSSHPQPPNPRGMWWKKFKTIFFGKFPPKKGNMWQNIPFSFLFAYLCWILPTNNVGENMFFVMPLFLSPSTWLSCGLQNMPMIPHKHISSPYNFYERGYTFRDCMCTRKSYEDSVLAIMEMAFSHLTILFYMKSMRKNTWLNCFNLVVLGDSFLCTLHAPPRPAFGLVIIFFQMNFTPWPLFLHFQAIPNEDPPCI